MFCKNCGNELKEGNSFCTNCGSAINKNSRKKYLILVIMALFICLCALWFVYNNIFQKKNVSENINILESSTKEQQNDFQTTEIKELKIKNLKFDINMKSDTSMEVVETWNISIKENSTLFKTFILDSSKYNSISNIRVSEIFDNGNIKNFTKIDTEMQRVPKDCYYGLVNSDGDFEIAWGVDTKNQTKTYQISYTVDGAVKVYNDCAELYWQFIGTKFSIPIDKIEGNIVIENQNNFDNVKVWGHSRNEGNIEKKENNIIFNQTNFREGNYLEIRLAMPKENFNSMNNINKDMLKQILEEENKN